MKKIASLVSTILLSALLMTACGTATPTPTESPVLANELTDYKIVYPAEYTELRMDIVNDLQDVIEHITNVRIEAIPDSAQKDGKEIILASSERSTALSDTVSSFASRMDYVVARDGNDIVLGGQNYYSDMRAVYDFIENYLGYNVIEDTYSTPTKALADTYTYIYSEPEFTINAACWATVFDDESYIKDIADANFNMLMVAFYKGTDEYAHTLTKWCAKYEIRLLLNIIGDGNSTMPRSYLYSDCPIIYGGAISDEPREYEFEDVQVLVDEFNEKYSEYGWRPMVNYAGDFSEDVENSEFLKNVDIMSFDWYIFKSNYWNSAYNEYFYGTSGEGSYYLKHMQTFMNIANEHDMDLWTYIQAYQSNDVFNVEKAYRWQMYMSLCFDAKGISYFEYANRDEPNPRWGDFNTLVVKRDMTKGDNYYYAQAANEEILKVNEMLEDYNYLGAYTYFQKWEKYYTQFDEYEGFDVIEDISDLNNDIYGDIAYLVGCFEKKDGSGKAFIFMNLEILTDKAYGEDLTFPTKLKIKGDNVTCYEKGEEIELTKDADGYYSFNCGNGQCLLFTVD